MTDQSLNLTFSPTATDVLTANPGLTFSIEQLQAIQAGTLIVVGTISPEKGKKSIEWLRYERDNHLTHLQIDGKVYGISGAFRVVNLNDFRERLQNAMDHGHGISFCFDSRTDKISMLNVFK